MGRGAAVREVLGTRLPADPATGRPVLFWWPVLLVGLVGAASVVLLDPVGGLPAVGIAAATVLARFRPVLAAGLLTGSLLAGGLLAGVGFGLSPLAGAVPPPWLLTLV